MNEVTASEIKSRLGKIHMAIDDAARSVGRSPAEVRIVAVTKGFSPEVVRSAYEAGLRDFGENRVQEGLEKMSQLADLESVNWHMIGHIQSRKAKHVAPSFSSVHSVGRLKIADRLNEYRAGPPLPILLQCNVSGESSKHGWDLADPSSWPQVIPEFSRILQMTNLRVTGLMTIAPWTSDEGVLQRTFKALRELADYLRRELPQSSWDELSMGMSDDYPIAVQQGATILRLGRAIFGERE